LVVHHTWCLIKNLTRKVQWEKIIEKEKKSTPSLYTYYMLPHYKPYQENPVGQNHSKEKKVQHRKLPLKLAWVILLLKSHRWRISISRISFLRVVVGSAFAKRSGCIITWSNILNITFLILFKLFPEWEELGGYVLGSVTFDESFLYLSDACNIVFKQYCWIFIDW